MKKPNGVVLWQGPSMIDGKPIMLIATGLNKSSRNGKTGNLIQTWILRSDIDPISAANQGDDASICGSCIHRGKVINGKNVGRTCYVTLFQAPLNIYKSFHRGIYSAVTLNEGQKLLAGRMVRAGAYGDPAAIPIDVWTALLALVTALTGYSHQWRTASPSFARYVMASCDTVQDAIDAQALGYRTFRVTALDSRQDKQAREVICPASKEAGHKTSCASCLACGGKSAKARANIVIQVHGMASKINAYKSNQLAA